MRRLIITATIAGAIGLALSAGPLVSRAAAAGVFPPVAKPAAAPAAPAAPAGDDDLRIGYVDFARIFEELPAAKAARDKLEKVLKEKQALLTAKLEDFKRIAKDFAEHKDIWPKAKVEEKKKSLEKMEKDLDEMYKRLREDFETKKGAEEKKIVEELLGHCAKLGKDRKYTMILDASAGVLWIPPHRDLTKEVMKMYKGK